MLMKNFLHQKNWIILLLLNNFTKQNNYCSKRFVDLLTGILYICILILSILKESNAQEILSANELRQLNKFELNRFRDFVKGKGHGSISRVPYNFGDDEDTTDSNNETVQQEFNFEHDDNIVDLGAQVQNLPFLIEVPLNSKESENFTTTTTTTTTTVKPKSTTTLKMRPTTTTTKETKIDAQNENDESEPTNEEYERLAKILQEFINKKNVKTKLFEKKNTQIDELKNLNNNENNLTSIMKTVNSLSVSPNKITNSVPKFRLLNSTKNKYKLNDNNRNNFRVWKGTVEKASTKSLEKIEFVNTAQTQKQTLLPTKNDEKNVDEIIEQNLDEYYDSNPPIPLKESINNENEDLQTKIRQMSQELSIVLQKLNKKKEFDVEETTTKTIMPLITKIEHPEKTYVIVLREGIARQTSSSQYMFVASITLIRDSGKIILVDTGLATDINGRTDLIKKLAKMNIAPPSVDYIITTHGHADHSGNTNDFPDAVHFQGTMSHFRTKFNFSDLFENDQHRLTPNVVLIKTPGHTPDDITAIVHNTNKYGTVGIVGDVFMAEEDWDFPMMWKPLAWNEKIQEKSRAKLICTTDYIVPGHGKAFRITSKMKNSVTCPTLKS